MRSKETENNYRSSYLFGFNGQEKDDEVYGEGNSTSAEFWQYDTRIGRRWNVDPVYKEYESPYATFGNNPIANIDPDADDTTISNNKSGNVIIWLTENGNTVDYKKEADQKNWDIIEVKNLKDAASRLEAYKKENNLEIISNVVIRHHGSTNKLAPYENGSLFFINENDVSNFKEKGTTGNAMRDGYLSSLRDISNIAENIFITACIAGNDVKFGSKLSSVLSDNTSLLLNQDKSQYNSSVKYNLFTPHERKSYTAFNECVSHPTRNTGCSFVLYYKSINALFERVKINSTGAPITIKRKK